jgi:hypothetical protein
VNSDTATRDVKMDRLKAAMVLEKTLSSNSILVQVFETIIAHPAGDDDPLTSQRFS